MSKPLVTALNAGQKLPAKAPQRRISAKLRKALDALVEGRAGSLSAAATLAKCDVSLVSRGLKEPHVQAYVSRRRREIIMRATARVPSVLESLLDADSEHVRRDVAFRLAEEAGDLQRSGGSQVAVNVAISPGYVVDWRPEDQRPALDVTPAKPLIDHEDIESGDGS